MSPVTPTRAEVDAYRGIGSPSTAVASVSPSPGRAPDGGRPAASQASTVLFLSVRWGASGQPMSKRDEWTVEVSVAAASSSR
jgi:hypothetical protein